MIIRELLNAGKETKHRLRELEQSGVTDPTECDFLLRKLSALNELQKYVTGGDWTRRVSREKFVALLRSGFDYKLTAERFRTKRESLDVFASRQDRRLYSVIGEALHLISMDRIEEGLSCFYANAGIISAKEFEYRVSELLPKGEKKDSFLVSDCTEEAAILRSLMKENLQKWLNGADSAKLSYLMFLLSTEETQYQQQRRELISELRKKDS